MGITISEGSDTITNDDIIIGNGGDDTLNGGLGADTFYFDLETGNDVIVDFNEVDGDKIDFGQINPTEIVKTTSGEDVIYTLSDNSTITLKDPTLNTLSTPTLISSVRSKTGDDLVIDFFATPELMGALSSITDYQLFVKLGNTSADFTTKVVTFATPVQDLIIIYLKIILFF